MRNNIMKNDLLSDDDEIISNVCLGSLDKLLFDSHQVISNQRKMELIQGIARGIFHLHKHNIVHRDLAARNILLSASGDPKISVHFI
jgi:serine/threonine protein kinase